MPQCGKSALYMSNILGRAHDSLIDRDGTRFTVAVLYGVLAKHMARIILYDFLQVEPGEALLRYVTDDGRPLEHETIERALRYVVPTLAITLKFMPELIALRDALPPRTKWKIVKTEG